MHLPVHHNIVIPDGGGGVVNTALCIRSGDILKLYINKKLLFCHFYRQDTTSMISGN